MTTEAGVNSTSAGPSGEGFGDDPQPLWFIVLDRTQLTMTIIGAVVNVMTVITLQKNGSGFHPCVSKFLIKVLFKNLLAKVTPFIKILTNSNDIYTFRSNYWK